MIGLLDQISAEETKKKETKIVVCQDIGECANRASILVVVIAMMRMMMNLTFDLVLCPEACIRKCDICSRVHDYNYPALALCINISSLSFTVYCGELDLLCLCSALLYT